MGNETKKSFARRCQNGDFKNFFQGKGIDIGCGNAPVTGSCFRFDKIFGNDMAELWNYKDEIYDFVYSSHCLEHFSKPQEVLEQWWRILKPGGYLIVVVPHWVLYEKRQFPSPYNSDHKSGFMPDILIDMCSGLHASQVLRLQVNEEGYDYNDKESDQTLKGAQAEIELIVRKVKDYFWADRPYG